MKGTNERKLKGFVVRKQVKDHGLKLVTKDRRGLKPPVVMADDVLTTGACLKKAVDAFRDKGLFCILDWQQANNELKKNHYKYRSLFTHPDL